MKNCLNIEIAEHGQTLACALYERSAKEDVAIDKIHTIVRETRNAEYRKVKDPVARAIWLLEMTGAGTEGDERKRIGGTPYTIARCLGVEDGFLYISAPGIEHSRSREEIRWTVYLDSNEVRRVNEFMTFEEFNQYYKTRKGASKWNSTSGTESSVWALRTALT